MPAASRPMTLDEINRAESKQVQLMTEIWNGMKTAERQIKEIQNPAERRRLDGALNQLRGQWTTAEGMLRELLDVKLKLDPSATLPKLVFGAMTVSADIVTTLVNKAVETTTTGGGGQKQTGDSLGLESQSLENQSLENQVGEVAQQRESTGQEESVSKTDENPDHLDEMVIKTVIEGMLMQIDKSEKKQSSGDEMYFGPQTTPPEAGDLLDKQISNDKMDESLLNKGDGQDEMAPSEDENSTGQSFSESETSLQEEPTDDAMYDGYESFLEQNRQSEEAGRRQAQQKFLDDLLQRVTTDRTCIQLGRQLPPLVNTLVEVKKLNSAVKVRFFKNQCAYTPWTKKIGKLEFLLGAPYWTKKEPYYRHHCNRLVNNTGWCLTVDGKPVVILELHLDEYREHLDHRKDQEDSTAVKIRKTIAAFRCRHCQEEGAGVPWANEMIAILNAIGCQPQEQQLHLLHI